MSYRTPLFGCASCYEDHLWPVEAEELREHDGEPWCDMCWDCEDMRETTGIDWGDLPEFVPDAEKRIKELEALLRELLPHVVNSNIPFRYVRKIEKMLGEREGKSDE